MPPVTLPCGEFAPDGPDYGSTGVSLAENVIPLTPTSYGPFPSPVAMSGVTALPSPPLGVVSWKDRTGAAHVFAGVADKIYRLSTGDAAWQDVSNPERTYSATDFNPWSATAFANSILFSNGVDPIQIYDFDQSTTAFADLSAQAPLAEFIASTGNFVITANVTEGGDSVTYPYRVHWGVDGVVSGAPYVWPDPGSDDAAETQSDYNDVRSDLGAITGLVAGLQNALFVIFLEQGVFWCTYQTSPIVFSFLQAQGAVGCPYRGSICSNRGIAYYVGTDGLYALDGSNINNIGGSKIDRWFFTDSNPTYRYNIQSAADPSGKYVYWSYASTGSATGTHDSLLIYNWSLSRFSYCRASVEWLARSLTRGISIDDIEGSIDDPDLPSLDSPIFAGGAVQLVGFDADGNICTFTGNPLAATIETQEVSPDYQDTPGVRSRVTEARPLIDGDMGDDTPTIAIGARSRLVDAVTWGADKPLSWSGVTPQRVDSRYFRARVVIPAGANWEHFLGVSLNASPSTRR